MLDLALYFTNGYFSTALFVRAFLLLRFYFIFLFVVPSGVFVMIFSVLSSSSSFFPVSLWDDLLHLFLELP